MKHSRIGRGIVALAAAGTLVLAGCSAGGDGEEGGEATGGGIITVNGSEPQNPLIPTNTNEVGGGKILDSIFAGLVYYDAEGAAHNDVAESIEPNEDSSEFTITLRDDAVFTDGTSVKAENFVKAWNQGASNELQHLSNYFFEDIEGFEISDGPDGEAGTDDDIYGAVEDMSGLTVVDDYTFTVKLKQPASDFPIRLGYSAFYPLPDVAFEDIDAFGQNPIGNGPYMIAGEGAWQHDVEIELAKNEDYNGPREVMNDGLKIIFYASQDAAYADLQGGNLDVLDAIPDSQLANFESDLGDRAVNQPAAIFQSYTIPSRLAHFDGEEGELRRAALSMAIDRTEITDVIFDGTRTPASDFTSPVIDGWSDSLAGAEVLEFNPEEAQAKWAEADAISPWEGTFEIAYNADGGHQAWVDAVANSIKNTLGIDAVGHPYPTFAEARTEITNRTIQTAFRTGWQADYPGLFNFLGPLYATNAGSNDGDYSNPEFDALLSEGSQETDIEAANALFQEAQEILLKDLPATPLWYSNVTGGFGESVENVQFGWNSVPVYHEITKN
ncbi:peptide ABC transporter substrate-binding protein [Leucobacter denitrificans]|uniref:ABC transporter substrate-binding protein n=1 Tax=Leucobacter denitrificans TaxID=683042 RepID=A0A7G9S6V0_9MICO|nr:ABC transporter substrate-binding protein [Leucobacter denitrificans]QNN63575.1 ABC transporter substrate-binding protein [Leucobacter denitrificans]